MSEASSTAGMNLVQREIYLDRKKALERRKALGGPAAFMSGPVRDGGGYPLTLQEVREQGDAINEKYGKVQNKYHATMKSVTSPEHTGVIAEVPMNEKVNIRGLARMCGLPGEHVRKMCDIFDREVPKAAAKVKGQDAPQQMTKPQFQRFMVKNGYKNATIVSRLFEVLN